MAELALIASILQVADIGLRLSLRLYTFGETVASADQSIRNISKDVSLTSAVLKELGNTFENDKARISSDNATNTAKDVVRECHTVFDEVETLLLKKIPYLSSASDIRSKAKLVLERLKWPAIKGKIELLSYTLDKMKGTLTLMLNVIIYAQQISQRIESPSVLAEQRQLIEYLAQLKQGQERALQQAQLRIDYDQAEPYPVTKGHIAQSRAGYSTKDAQFPAQVLSTLQTATNPVTEETSEKNVMWNTEAILREYTRLQDSLLGEVRSANYNIESDSRARIQTNIITTNKSEIVRIRQQTELEGRGFVPSIPVCSKKDRSAPQAGSQESSQTKMFADLTDLGGEEIEVKPVELPYVPARQRPGRMPMWGPSYCYNPNSRSSLGSHYIPSGESFASQKGGVQQPTSASNQMQGQQIAGTGAEPEPTVQQVQIIEAARAWPEEWKKGVKRGKRVYDEQREEDVEDVEDVEEVAEEVQEVAEEVQDVAKEDQEVAEEVQGVAEDVQEVAEDEEPATKNEEKKRNDGQTTLTHGTPYVYRPEASSDEEPRMRPPHPASSNNMPFDTPVFDLLSEWTTLDYLDIMNAVT